MAKNGRKSRDSRKQKIQSDRKTEKNIAEKVPLKRHNRGIPKWARTDPRDIGTYPM